MITQSEGEFTTERRPPAGRTWGTPPRPPAGTTAGGYSVRELVSPSHPPHPHPRGLEPVLRQVRRVTGPVRERPGGAGLELREPLGRAARGHLQALLGVDG